ncbi:MAG: hypothetical protein KatS3mg073_1100 [Meiothermus sp.]|nr:MAG: hypothetical protein KatS3mg073_1100 [Meiothermus sp.]
MGGHCSVQDKAFLKSDGSKCVMIAVMFGTLTLVEFEFGGIRDGCEATGTAQHARNQR